MIWAFREVFYKHLSIWSPDVCGLGYSPRRLDYKQEAALGSGQFRTLDRLSDHDDQGQALLSVCWEADSAGVQ